MDLRSERHRGRKPLILAAMLVFHLLLIVLSTRLSGWVASGAPRMLLSAAFQIVSCLLPALFYRLLGAPLVQKTMTIECMPSLPMFFIAVALISGVLQINLFICDLFSLSGNPSVSSTVTGTDGIGGVLLSVFCYVLVPAFCEEIFYRGALLSAFGGCRFGILLSALCFGVTHFNLYGLLYTTAAGIVLAVCAAATGSLRLPIAVHGVLNLIVLGLSYAEEFFYPSGYALLESLIWSLVFGAGVIFAVYSLLNYGRVRLAQDSESPDALESTGTERERETFRTVILPLIYIVLLILWQLVRLLP